MNPNQKNELMPELLAGERDPLSGQDGARQRHGGRPMPHGPVAPGPTPQGPIVPGMAHGHPARPGLSVHERRKLAKTGMAVALGALVGTGFLALQEKRFGPFHAAHMAAGAAMVGLSYWHWTLYQQGHGKGRV